MRRVAVVLLLTALIVGPGSARAAKPFTLAEDTLGAWVDGGRALGTLHVERTLGERCPAVSWRVLDRTGRVLAEVGPFDGCQATPEVFWQPGGTLYAVVRYDVQGPPELALVDWRTGEERIVGRSGSGPVLWSDAGTRLAFLRADENGALSLAAFDLASGATTVLGSGLPAGWSADGTRLVTFERDGSSRVIDVATATTVPMPTGVLAFSPDLGAGVLAPAPDRLLVLDLADGSRTRAPNGYDIAWSPVGRRFAISTRGGGLAIGEVDGPVRQVVPDLVDAGDSRSGPSPPAWSPDSSRVAYVDLAGRLLVLAADGRRLADLGVLPRDARWAAWRRDLEPVQVAWSPDGARLATDAGFGCGRGIKLVRASGGGLRWLTNDCRIDGTPGSDRIEGTPGPDVIRAGGGDDVVVGGDGRDVILGGPGDDRLVGGAHDDELLGGSGNDTISDGAGTDHLVGGPGDDRLVDRLGRDLLEGGPGDDLLGSLDGWPDLLDGGPGIDLARGGGTDVLRGVEQRLAEALA